MSHSSKSSTLSRKKEKLALPQLKRSQLSKQHELKRKMAELKLEEEAMEAEMEEERALVSVNVYNEEVGVDLVREDTHNHKVTTLLQRFETRSPFVQPYVLQETLAQSANTVMQSVPITSVSKCQVEQSETRPPFVQPYVPKETLAQSANTVMQPVPITSVSKSQVEQFETQTPVVQSYVP